LGIAIHLRLPEHSLLLPFFLASDNCANLSSSLRDGECLSGDSDFGGPRSRAAILCYRVANTAVPKPSDDRRGDPTRAVRYRPSAIIAGVTDHDGAGAPAAEKDLLVGDSEIAHPVPGWNEISPTQAPYVVEVLMYSPTSHILLSTGSNALPK
jgi:hypothetical protein